MVRGSNAGACTFIVTAIGHSYGARKGNADAVCGLDVNEPAWFVPVPRVTYLCGCVDADAKALFRMWEAIHARPGNLILLNGPHFQPLQSTAIHASHNTPVVLCVEPSNGTSPPRTGMPEGTIFLEVSNSPGSRIQVALARR